MYHGIFPIDKFFIKITLNPWSKTTGHWIMGVRENFFLICISSSTFSGATAVSTAESPSLRDFNDQIFAAFDRLGSSIYNTTPLQTEPVSPIVSSFLWILSILVLLAVMISITLVIMLRYRQKMHYVLQAQEKKYRDLFAHIPIGLFRTGQDGRIYAVNKALYEMLGYASENDLQQITSVDLYARPADRNFLLQHLQKNEILPRFETQFKRKDGSLIDVNLTARTIKGDRIYFEGSVEDITERKNAERALLQHQENLESTMAERTQALQAANEELRQEIKIRERVERALSESEQKYRLLADISPVGLAQMDKEFRLTYANDEWLQMAGRPLAEVQGNLWVRVIHPEDRALVLQTWHNTMENEDQFSAEVRLRAPDGAITWIIGRTSALRDPNTGDVTGYLGTMTNISKQKKIEHALETARKEAEAATRAKTEFVANMSHEIRTPLNAVIGMTNLLLDSPLDTEQRDFAETMRSSGELLLSIINNVLDISKIEAHKLELENQPFNLPESVCGVMELLKEKAEEKGLSLSCKIAPDLPQFIHGDVTRLRQILVNLVANGIKFTTNGSVTVTLSGKKVTEALYQLQFMVRDTGIGIAPEKIPQLFKAFSQLDPSTTRNFGGTGLGLTISKRLCELMNGRMWVESQPDQGTTFYFTIEAAGYTAYPKNGASEKPMIKTAPQQFDNSLAQRNPLRILLAEDNLINQKVALKLLQRFGYEADVVANGKDAVTAAGEQQYDLILMDVQMPVMDGVEATRKIQTLLPAENRPRIVALTADALNGARETYIAAGMDDYLSKPVRVDNLRAILEQSATQAVE